MSHVLSRLFGRLQKRDLRAALERNPLDADLHFQYGKYCLSAGDTYLGIAELKTAVQLGKNIQDVETELTAVNERAQPLTRLTHNLFFRCSELAREIERLSGGQNSSVLDIGGGHGILAQFIPSHDYCLVEPSVNGISGIDLPFQDKSFDFVVACHVLEHIPEEERELFLDQLCAKAKKAVILLNPFAIEGTSVRARLELFIEITGAQWAREHLECGLPQVEMVEAYAHKKALKYSVRPNGTLATGMAMAFVDHFAKKAGCHNELGDINQFFNTNFREILDSEKYPTAYLIVMEL